MISKEQLDRMRQWYGDLESIKGKIILKLCNDVEALRTKPAIPNPKAEKLMAIVNMLTPLHPMRKNLQEAAYEIDRLTQLLRWCDEQEACSCGSLEIERRCLKCGAVWMEKMSEHVSPTEFCHWIPNQSKGSWNTSCGIESEWISRFKTNHCPYCHRPIRVPAKKL